MSDLLRLRDAAAPGSFSVDGAKYVLALEAECGRLQEQLDAAHQRVGEADAQRMVAIRKNDARVRELEQLDAARQALEFYADPMTYFGIAIFPDEPAGDFMDDFSEVPWPDGGTNVKPGKRARAALGVAGEQENPQ